MNLIVWIIFGLIAGIVAKLIMPGKDGGGFIMTTLLGIAGAFLGGFIGSQFGLGNASGFNIPSFITAVVGALILLFIYRLIKKK